MRRFLALAITLAAVAALPTETSAADKTGPTEEESAPSPWSGQVGAGADLWFPVIAPTLRGAVSHDDVPIWFDLRASWGPYAEFGAAELGAANRLLPASRITPVWTARWGIVLDSATPGSTVGVFVTSGVGMSARLSDDVSLLLGTELTASPDFGLLLPRLNAFVNYHF